MWLNLQETANLVTFPEETLNGKLNFLYKYNENFMKFMPQITS